MLKWLKGVVEEVTSAFGGEAPIRNGQAVMATIKSSNVKVDLAPAGIFNRTTDGSTFYNIPRGDSGNGWIPYLLKTPYSYYDRRKYPCHSS